MKKSIILFVASFLISCSSVQEKMKHDSRLRTETVVNKYSTVKTTYRDDEKILEEVTTKYNDITHHTRSIYFNGKLKFIESDENSDGFLETLLIPSKDVDLSDFEIFIRDKSGNIEPISSQKLAKKKKQISDVLQHFRKEYKKVIIRENSKLRKAGTPVPEWNKKELKNLE